MTINSFSSLSFSQSERYQSSHSHCCESKGTLRYSTSEGDSVKIEQSSSSSLAYHLSINNGDRSESLVYSRQSSQITQVEKVEEPPLLDGANNILGFIEQRLAAEVEAGATEEELSQLIEQGLAGFKQGYGEAIDILKLDDSFGEAAENSVSTLYSQVLSGFEALTEQYTPAMAKAASEADATKVPLASKEPQAAQTPNIQSSASSQTRLLRFSSAGGIEQMESINSSTISSQRIIEDLKAVEPTVLEQKNEPLKTPAEASSADIPYANEQTRIEYGLKERFSFTLQTQDGDKVTIDALNTEVYAAKINEQNNANGQKSQLVEGLKSSEKYTFSIEGELDDSETQAIQELMGQVMELADTFYNGNIDAAYEQALAVGYDQNEIASYSISMKQVEQYSVSSAYQDVASESSQRPSLNGAFDAIGDYTSQLVEHLHQPHEKQGIDISSLLNTIAEQLDEQVEHAKGAGFKDSISPFLDS